MAYVDLTSQLQREQDAGAARKMALQQELVRGLQGFADIERQKKAEERQAALDAIKAQDREIKLAQMGYVSPEQKTLLDAEQASSFQQAQAQPEGFEGPMQPTQEASQQAGFARFLQGQADQAQADRQRALEDRRLKLEQMEREREQASLPYKETRDYQKQITLQGLRDKSARQRFAEQKELEGMRQAGRKAIAQQSLIDRRKKESEKQKEGVAPGYKIDEKLGIKPTSMESRQFRAAISDATAFKNNITNVENIIKENEGVPSQLFSPNTYNRMQQEMTKAKLDLKGEEFFKLGVLAGPDMELIDKTFGEIDGLFGTWQPGNEKVALEKLKAIKDYVDNKVSSKASSLGYVKDMGQVEQGDLQKLSDAELDAMINQYAGN